MSLHTFEELLMHRGLVALIVCLVPAWSLAAPAPRYTKLNFFWVAAKGPMSNDLALNRLRVYRHVTLRGCKIPETERKQLRGDVMVRGTVSGTGRLKIQQFKASHEHESLGRCLRRNVASWRMTNQQYDVGTQVSFKFYISFLKERPDRTVAIPPSLDEGFGYGGGARSGGARSGGARSSGARSGGARSGGARSGGARSGGARSGGSRDRAGGASGAQNTGVRRSHIERQPPLQVTVVSGILSKEVISKLMQQVGVRKDLHHCYRVAASRRPRETITGEMRLLMRIDRLGAVDRMEVIFTSIQEADLQRCFLALLVGKPFPKASSSTTLELQLSVP